MISPEADRHRSRIQNFRAFSFDYLISILDISRYYIHITHIDYIDMLKAVYFHIDIIRSYISLIAAGPNLAPVL